MQLIHHGGIENGLGFFLPGSAVVLMKHELREAQLFMSSLLTRPAYFRCQVTESFPLTDWLTGFQLFVEETRWLGKQLFVVSLAKCKVFSPMDHSLCHIWACPFDLLIIVKLLNNNEKSS